MAVVFWYGLKTFEKEYKKLKLNKVRIFDSYAQNALFSQIFSISVVFKSVVLENIGKRQEMLKKDDVLDTFFQWKGISLTEPRREMNIWLSISLSKLMKNKNNFTFTQDKIKQIIAFFPHNLTQSPSAIDHSIYLLWVPQVCHPKVLPFASNGSHGQSHTRRSWGLLRK